MNTIACYAIRWIPQPRVLHRYFEGDILDKSLPATERPYGSSAERTKRLAFHRDPITCN